MKRSSALAMIAILLVVAISAGAYNIIIPPTPVTKTLTETRTQTLTQTGAVTQTVTQPVTQTITQPVTQTVTQTVTATPETKNLLAPSPSPLTPPPANKRDGTLISAEASVPLNMDPWHIGIPGTFIIYGLYDSLLMMGADGKLYPSLATTLTRPDPLTYILTLRKDVKFHDGTPLTAKDVKATFDRGIKTTVLRSYAVASIKSVDVVDDYTVRFILNRRDSDFPVQLASHTSIHSAARIEKYGEDIIKQTPVGTGPFKFVEYIPGDRIVGDRNEQYWGPPAFLKRWVVRFIKEEAVRSLEIQKGGIHFMYWVNDARFIEDLEKAGLQVYPYPPGFFTRDLTWNNRLPWAKDINVRKAINYALDRKAFADVLDAGRATPCIGPVPPWMVEYHNPNLKTGYEYNVAKAKELMAKSAYPNGFTIKLLVGSEPEEVASPIIINNLGAIGIKVEVERVEGPVASRRTLFEKSHEMRLQVWGGSAPTPQGTFELRWLSENAKPWGWNYFLTNETEVGKKIDGIVQGFIVEDDLTKKKQLLEEFQTTIQESAVYACLTYRILYGVASHQMKGYEPFPRHIFYPGIIHAPQVGVGVWMDPDEPIGKKK